MKETMINLMNLREGSTDESCNLRPGSNNFLSFFVFNVIYF
jgi:hypothetical protein